MLLSWECLGSAELGVAWQCQAGSCAAELGVGSATVEGTQLEGTQLAETQLEGTQLDETQLEGTQPAGTQLEETQVVGAQLASESYNGRQRGMARATTADSEVWRELQQLTVRCGESYNS